MRCFCSAWSKFHDDFELQDRQDWDGVRLAVELPGPNGEYQRINPVFCPWCGKEVAIDYDSWLRARLEAG